MGRSDSDWVGIVQQVHIPDRLTIRRVHEMHESARLAAPRRRCVHLVQVPSVVVYGGAQ
jgi:hypothetical protein